MVAWRHCWLDDPTKLLASSRAAGQPWCAHFREARSQLTCNHRKPGLPKLVSTRPDDGECRGPETLRGLVLQARISSEKWRRQSRGQLAYGSSHCRSTAATRRWSEKILLDQAATSSNEIALSRPSRTAVLTTAMRSATRGVDRVHRRLRSRFGLVDRRAGIDINLIPGSTPRAYAGLALVSRSAPQTCRTATFAATVTAPMGSPTFRRWWPPWRRTRTACRCNASQACFLFKQLARNKVQPRLTHRTALS